MKANKNKKWNWKPYIITVLTGLAICLISALSQGIFSVQSSAEMMKILSDCFTLGGGLLMAAWVFAWVSGEGGFLFMEYTASIIRKMFTSKKKSLAIEDREESYGDYVEKKQSHGRGRRYICVLIVGTVYFLIGIAFSVLFFRTGG